MKYSFLILVALISSVLLSGCVDTQPTAKMDTKNSTATPRTLPPVVEQRPGEIGRVRVGEIVQLPDRRLVGTPEGTLIIPENNSNESTETRPLPIPNLLNTNNISFSWEFGCIRFCKEDSESTMGTNSILLITNTGDITIPNMKLHMQFYKNSGTLANERSALIDAVPVGATSSMYINVPNIYLNEEVWSYAELYLVYNNSRNHLATWKSEYIKVKDGERKVLPILNGTFEMVT